jgi:hypothetical protein
LPFPSISLIKSRCRSSMMLSTWINKAWRVVRV